jgi:DNA-binding NtrC family response regulator
MVSDWPGNVRQLCNEIQRTVARAEDGTVITPEQLSPELKRTSSPTTPSAASLASMPSSNLQTAGTLAEALAEVERTNDRRCVATSQRKHLTRRT